MEDSLTEEQQEIVESDPVEDVCGACNVIFDKGDNIAAITCCDEGYAEYDLTCADWTSDYGMDCTGCNCPGDVTRKSIGEDSDMNGQPMSSQPIDVQPMNSQPMNVQPMNSHEDEDEDEPRRLSRPIVVTKIEAADI